MATTLAAAISATDNVIDVSGDDLAVARATEPQSGYRITIGTEQMWVYEATADQARVTRGIEGTSAAVHAAAATVTVGKGRSVMFTKAGAISDSDFDADALPPVGTVCFDTTNHKFYVREGAATWKSSAALT